MSNNAHLVLVCIFGKKSFNPTATTINCKLSDYAKILIAQQVHLHEQLLPVPRDFACQEENTAATNSNIITKDTLKNKAKRVVCWSSCSVPLSQILSPNHSIQVSLHPIARERLQVLHQNKDNLIHVYDRPIL